MIKILIFPLCLASPAAAQGTAESQLAKDTLAALQTISFARNREYCGYLIVSAQGDLVATRATPGNVDNCQPNPPYDDAVIVASYHTHGAFDLDAPAEFPSVDDIEADEAEGINGYVSTPGGRFWYIDTTDMEVSQLCSVGCLPQDPNFVAGLDGEIAQSYSYQELLDGESH